MGSRVLIRSLVAAAIASVLVAGVALAGVGPNPANKKRLASQELEDYRYDDARKCRDRQPKGITKMLSWLDRHTRGSSWGVYRCEKLSRGNYSLHAESRAIDWHMDARDPKLKRQAMKLIRKRWLADDRNGAPAALARRMGVQGIIYNCKAWWSGQSGLGEYSYCYKKPGKKRRHLNPTAAHVDHIHIELNKPGSRAKTSFWRSGIR